MGRTLTLLVVLAIAAGVAAQPGFAKGRAECEGRSLPGGVALCDGTGEVSLTLEGSVVMSVSEGTVGVAGRPKARRAVPQLPSGIEPTQDGEFRVWTGTDLGFFLPKGLWRIRIEGSGVSLSLGFKSRGSIGLRGTAGFISLSGRPFRPWPKTWQVYVFGPRRGR